MPIGKYERKNRGQYSNRYVGHCYCCGETGNEGYSWYINHDAEYNALCGLCYRRLILNPNPNSVALRKKWNNNPNRGHRRKSRQCYCCGTHETHINSVNGCEYWLLNHDSEGNVLCFKCRRKISHIKKPMKVISRKCYCCGTIKSKDGTRNWEAWILNHDQDNNALCKKCYSRLIGSPIHNKSESYKKWMKINGPSLRQKRVMFLGKSVRTDEQPRRGECMKCGKTMLSGMIKRTNMHHREYDWSDPLANTIELCSACHRWEHQAITHCLRLN